LVETLYQIDVKTGKKGMNTTKASENTDVWCLPEVEVSCHTILYREHAISVLSQRYGPYLCRNL
jgi:hypothetical protein